MRKLLLALTFLGVGTLSGIYVTVRGISPETLFIASALYASRAYELGCIKHEMFNQRECVSEARELFNKHVAIFTK